MLISAPYLLLTDIGPQQLRLVYGASLTSPPPPPTTSDLIFIKSPFRMLPFSLGAALVGAISGAIVTRIARYREVIWFGWTMMVLGWGLTTQLDDTSST